ncbi:TPA: type I restriction-modification system endonuclease [Vibrio parahaemolyticus]|uniref:type I restriction-modification system endonuclease n=1 Tax=Vibrio parahaemolyticus TaxID=670 RepID=UPI001A8CC4DD|nr:type I restriction-modification system endonuclease [Vibrio parahaemolyticus]MBO0156020.1 type I restriction-modification system endonuclease [Vibrio parahaemolyticus]MBO0171595.1 type I restriction-modification system endonuclease [Vibrio parahaemolyticus]MCX8857410.1 type I restriction-modification system endonuclease [Vibrio parahaemolyticus]MCX8861217.1 type I restriction-modification system endonuclease [Vibrio parahaemolyticus]MCX8867953.1 type I restriction-modification system endonu
MDIKSTSNFSFLAEHDPLFLELAIGAERAFSSDPNTTLIKLRQLGEAIAQHIAVLVGVEFDDKTTQADLIYRLNRELKFEPVVKELFHTLRIEGNKATHQFKTQHKEALDGLKLSRALSIWFHQSFGKQGTQFKPGPFVPPQDPSNQLRQLQSEIERLKSDLTQANVELDTSKQLHDLIVQEKAEYEALAFAMDEESKQLAGLAAEHESALIKQKKEYEAKVKALQQQLEQQDEKDTVTQKQQVSTKTRKASQQIVLSEELTRILIDQQLIEAGWTADSQELTYKNGTRPEKGINKAIAEWPTKHNGENGRADYVLFLGLTPIAVVEAKKENTNVAGKITQSERYSRGFQVDASMVGAWELEGLTIAWVDEDEGHYKVPFVYSCNGRPYIPQLAEQSGKWFRDVRKPSNTKRALQEFHTPDGLIDLLKRNKEIAERKLQQEGFSYLKLRDYQEKAIHAVESTLAKDIRTALLAMATGTGKTRTIVGLMYRFLKSERFKRILFLVDRTALGDQATDTFKEMPLEQNQTLSKIYNIAELGDMAAEAETRVQVATVQAMVKRIFMSDTPPAIDEFDCIIVDEAHRGYTLDQEMTEGELATRDAGQYLSSYRRVLDYFDAVKVGLTATPAKHTSEIFGKPVYTYSYREAVAADWLIDHEPPVRYETLLTQNGIHFDKGDKVSAINTQTGEVESAELEDELQFEVDAFNRRVINENFNRVICEQLVHELDPFGEEKTLIFCATDLHADMVKRLLDEAFKDLYEDEYNQAAVEKITGKSDKVDQLIRKYKNETYPNIAITVDLLTTGIDVPKICNLVFLRRVKSRILYEQMIGRATRRCDDIGKTIFRIYDPVDIYAALSDVNTMKPLVKDPNITIEQLVDELVDPEKLEQALSSPGDQQGESQADAVLSQLTQKVMRVLRKAEKRADAKPELREKLNELQTLWGVEPKLLHKHLHQLGPKQASQFVQQHSGLLSQLEEVVMLIGSERKPVLSNHPDEPRGRWQDFGTDKRPVDYLESFDQFIKQQLNQSAALAVIVNKPRDLTREQLQEVKLLLDGEGYSEAKLRAAIREETNQDIAASILGHIRRAALGEPLVPFEQRVMQAMDRIYSSNKWTPNQRKWLERLAKQLVHEVIVDREYVNERFAEKGGAKQLDKVLVNKLDDVLSELNDAMWPAQAAN